MDRDAVIARAYDAQYPAELARSLAEVRALIKADPTDGEALGLQEMLEKLSDAYEEGYLFEPVPTSEPESWAAEPPQGG